MKTKSADGQNLLIPFDFSDVCEAALSYGLEMAAVCKLRILLLHVVTHSRKSGIFTQGEGAYTFLRRLNAIRSRCLESSSVEIEVIVKSGKLIEEIEQTAKTFNCSMILLGTHGKQGIQNLYGSYALKIAVESPCPVITIPGQARGGRFKHILIPVSAGSDLRPGIPFLIQLAQQCNTRVTLCSETTTDASNFMDIAHDALEEITLALSSAGLQVYHISTPANSGFTESLVAKGKELGCDLIVIRSVSGSASPAYGFETWNERLMFNEPGIPVMTIPVA